MFKVSNERKTLRKIAFLLSAFLIITFCLGSNITVKANTEIDISEPVKLKWLVIGNGDQEDIDLVQEEINAYLEDKINATLELKTYTWDTYEEHFALILAGGESYDINYTTNWTVNYRAHALFPDYFDITDLLDTYAPKTKDLLGKNILKGAEVNGRIYALPVYNSSIINDYGILLNEELVNKYKVDVSKIKKLQDLEPILKTIKSKEKGVIGFYPFNSYGDSVENLLNYDRLIEVPGAVLRDGKSTKVVNEYETSEAKAMFSLMNKWYKAGYIPKISEPNSSYYDTNFGNFFAMYSSISAFTSYEIGVPRGYSIIPIHLGKPALTTSSVSGSMHAISANSESPERALMLLELVNTDKTLSNLINYGIEGYHYEKTGDSTIKLLKDDGQSYTPGTTWLFGNESIVYSLTGSDPEGWNKQNELVKSAVPSPLLGFEVNSDTIESQVNKIQKIEEKYLNNLVIGKVDPNKTLSKMNSEMNKAGLKKVLAEMQKQVDKFVKQKK